MNETARCRVCESRSMSDQAMPPDAWEIVAPSGLVHLTEGSGYTFCGKNCAPWEGAWNRAKPSEGAVD